MSETPKTDTPEDYTDNEPRNRGKWAHLRWAVVAGGASLLLWLNRRLFTVNDVTAGKSREYPRLKPRVYNRPVNEAFSLAEATARDHLKWRVTSIDRIGHEIEAEARVPLLSVLDDVTIRVDPLPDAIDSAGGASSEAPDGLDHASDRSSRSQVVVRSRSRIGIGDLGENARRIGAFYRALDRRMQTLADLPRAVNPTMQGSWDDSSSNTAPPAEPDES